MKSEHEREISDLPQSVEFKFKGLQVSRHIANSFIITYSKPDPAEFQDTFFQDEDSVIEIEEILNNAKTAKKVKVNQILEFCGWN